MNNLYELVHQLFNPKKTKDCKKQDEGKGFL